MQNWPACQRERRSQRQCHANDGRTLGLAGTEPGGRGTLPLSAQAVYDRGLALGLLLSAGIFAAAGQIEATALFAAAGIAALAMTSVTRYSARAT